MSILTDKIHSFKHYEEEFATWEATEQIIDGKKSFWMLRKLGSECEKVCLFVDGYFMVVYGDYGTMTFNQMTWKGSVYNLHYDNIGYQMEKLSHESRDTMHIFDSEECKADILEWLKGRLENCYDAEEDVIDKIVSFVEEGAKSYIGLDDDDIEVFCEDNGYDDMQEIIGFAADCLGNTDEYDWIAFLRNSSEFNDFDEPCESELWNAGKRIHQRYFINMYALKVCAEKLKAAQTN